MKAPLSVGMEVPVKISTDDPLAGGGAVGRAQGLDRGVGWRHGRGHAGPRRTPTQGTADAAGRAYLAGKEKAGCARPAADDPDPAERCKKLHAAQGRRADQRRGVRGEAPGDPRAISDPCRRDSAGLAVLGEPGVRSSPGVRGRSPAPRSSSTAEPARRRVGTSRLARSRTSPSFSVRRRHVGPRAPAVVRARRSRSGRRRRRGPRDRARSGHGRRWRPALPPA